MKIYYIIFIMIILNNNVFAQEDKTSTESKKTPAQREEDFQNSLKERILNNQKDMEKFFQSSDFTSLRNRMHKLMESFGEHDDLNIEDFLDQTLKGQKLGNHTFGQRAGLQTEWRETESEMILVIKAKVNKKDPFNITVENGMIKISGTSTNEVKNKKGIVISKSKSSVNISQNIPRSVDPETIRYDQDKNGFILVAFTKRSIDKAIIKKNAKPVKPSNNLKPLKPDSDDLTI